MAGQLRNRSSLQFFFLGATLFFVVFAAIFLNKISTHKEVTDIHYNAYVARIATPAAGLKHGFENTATKLAIPFGKKDTLTVTGLQNATSEIRKRDERDDAIVKGIDRLTDLNGPRTQTQWTRLEDMTGPPGGPTRGWTTETVNAFFYRAKGYDDAYQELGISRDDDQKVFANQYQRFSNCRYDDLEETGGSFINVYNVPGRTLIATSNQSPANSFSTEPPAKIGNVENVPWQQRLPDVSKWSDVVAILWNEQSGGQATNLKYIFRQAIVTAATRTVMNQVFDQSGSRINRENKYEKRWPGYKFNVGDENFAALLGTAHGAGVYFLLLQHPNELPGKSIESIQIFTTPDVDNDYHMLFTLTG